MNDQNKTKATIRATLVPDYYPQFQCIGGQCKDSCCCGGGWEIPLTKNDYMTLRRHCRSGALKSRFAGGVRRIRGAGATDMHYAQFVMQERKCPLLNEAGLCALQLECGAAVLPQVCRTFPRATTATPWGLEEACCSLGCEAVLHLLYQRRDGLDFVMEDKPPEQQDTAIFDFPEFLQGETEAVRALCVDILQNRTMPLPRRVLLMGWVLRDLADQVAAGGPPIGQWLAQKRDLVAADEVGELLGQFKGNRMLFLLHNLKQLLIEKDTTEEIAALCEKCVAMLVTSFTEDGTLYIAPEPYQAAEEEFYAAYGDLEFFFENMLVNVFFYRHYPVRNNVQDIWKNYIDFCNLYSALQFFAICGCQGHRDMDHLFHTLTVAGRHLMHSDGRRIAFSASLIESGSTTLADMAILVCG